MGSLLVVSVIAGLVGVLWPSASSLAGADHPGAKRWLVAFAMPMAEARPDNAVAYTTYRNIAHLSVGGPRVRVRLSNAFGSRPLTFASAWVGVREKGASLRAGSAKRLTVSGSPSIAIRPREYLYTDEVALPVAAGDDLAVSLYVDSAQPVSMHARSNVTHYSASAGPLDDPRDYSSDESGDPFTSLRTDHYWVDAIDVLTDEAKSSVVVLGDSISDKFCATRDANDGWVDVLADRAMVDNEQFEPRSVVSAGINANFVSREASALPVSDGRTGGVGPPAVDRLERDVLSQSGVTDVLVFSGSNDIAGFRSVESIVGAYREIHSRLRDHGVAATIATIIPRVGLWYAPVQMNAARAEVNSWIRDNRSYAGVHDFDAVVRSPLWGDMMDVQYDCGDGIHPNSVGHRVLGDSVDLAELG